MNVLRVITLVLVALLFLRDLRSKRTMGLVGTASKLSVRLLEEIKETTHPAEIYLVGPSQLRRTTITLAERAEGEVVWFNACPLMFESKELCDVILRPFLVIPSITSVRIVLDHAQREYWHTRVEATLQDYLVRSTVAPPTWADLDSAVSFILTEIDSVNGKAEALVSFWGGPFMAVNHDRKIRGYMIHVREHSQLISRFCELVRAAHLP